MLADWAGKRKAKWYALIPATGVLLATPCYIYAYTRERWAFAAWLLLLPGLFHYSYIGPTLGVIRTTSSSLACGPPRRPSFSWC